MTDANLGTTRIAEMMAADGGADAGRMRAAVDQVRARVIAHAEELYRLGMARTERADLALAEFDRQSEIALVQASTAVELARQKLRESRAASSADRRGDWLAQLEGDLMQAQAHEVEVLRERTDGRDPLEMAWRSAAAEVCVWGGALLRAFGSNVVGYVGGGRSDLAWMPPPRSLEKSFNGAELHAEDRSL